MYESITHDFIDFAEKNPTPFHVIDAIKEEALMHKAVLLRENKQWDIKPGKTYITKRNGSSAIMWRVPKKRVTGFNIVAVHTDSPALKLKGMKSEISDGPYLKLNVECYGGLLMSTWFDRPLSLAGRVLVKEGKGIQEKLINIDRDLLIIPSVAIHMNRDANKGINYNPQIDLLPLMGLVSEGGKSSKNKTESKLEEIIAHTAGTDPKSILSCDLFVYNRTPGTIWGSDKEFFSVQHIDDLQCSYGAFRGFMDAKLDDNQTSMPMLVLFDNEEVGSGTKQGADSTFLKDVIENISEALNMGKQELNAVVAGSLMISADNAHAVHPNHPEHHDPQNRPVINKGIVIKYAANQHYTTDGVSAALFKEICNISNVPFQEYYNRSDSPGGSTLGNIVTAHLGLNAVDIGLPQLAMHSCYETAGVKDTAFLAKALKTFFSKTIVPEDGYKFK